MTLDFWNNNNFDSRGPKARIWNAIPIFKKIRGVTVALNDSEFR